MADREALQALVTGLLRDERRGSRHAGLLLMLVLAYITKRDLALPPSCLWKVPSIAVH